MVKEGQSCTGWQLLVCLSGKEQGKWVCGRLPRSEGFAVLWKPDQESPDTFLFCSFLSSPVKFLLVKLKFWHTHNAIFKKRAGVFLAGSFCGLAKYMFPDLTQQSGKAGQGLGLFYSLISFCRGAMDFPALHIGTQVELINICLQKWTQWILIIFHIKTDILLRLTVYKLYWASNWIA